MTRLRLGLRNLHEHKFNHNVHNYINSLCRCGMDIESPSHYFLYSTLVGDKKITPEHPKAKLTAN